METLAYTLTTGGHGRHPQQWDPNSNDLDMDLNQSHDNGHNWTQATAAATAPVRAPLDNMIFHHFNQNLGTNSAEGGLNEDFAAIMVPNWALVTCTVILTLTITIGIPLNGATILIFLKCKKLRHLVNFVLLLDCISHLILMFTAIPVQLIGVWNRLPFHHGSSSVNINAGRSVNHEPSGTTINGTGEVNQALVLLQQLTTNFVNLTGVLFIFTIAILRYRRLCWKKKDRLSIINGLKWSLANVSVASAFTAVQGWAYYENIQRGSRAGEQLEVGQPVNMKPDFISRWQYNTYLVKISVIMFLMVTAVFCYIRVSQRIWTKTTSHEQGIDVIKLKKSRTVHLRATIHSCIQIILVLVTILPHFYEETVTIDRRGLGMKGAIELDSGTVAAQQQYEYMAPGTAAPPLPPSLRFTLFEQDDLNKSLDTAATPGITTHGTPASTRAASESEGLAAAQIDLTDEQRQAQLLIRLLALTINYSLLILGTPTAYIASCHRFREQFARILCSHRLPFGLRYLFPMSTSQSPYHNHHGPRRSSGGSRRRSRSSVARRGSNCPMANGHCAAGNGVAHTHVNGVYAHVHLHESPDTAVRQTLSRRGQKAYDRAHHGHANENGRNTFEVVSTTTGSTPSYFDQYSSSTSGYSRRSSSCRGTRRSISNSNGAPAQTPKIVIEAETPTTMTPVSSGKVKRKLARGVTLPAGSARFEQLNGGRRSSNSNGKSNGNCNGNGTFDSIHIINDSSPISSFAKVVTIPLRLNGRETAIDICNCPSDTTSTATTANNSNSNSHSSLDPFAASGFSNNSSSIYQLL